jgi:hypothetical protein
MSVTIRRAHHTAIVESNDGGENVTILGQHLNNSAGPSRIGHLESDGSHVPKKVTAVWAPASPGPGEKRGLDCTRDAFRGVVHD